MNMDDRMTICNMVVEAGGKNGVIAPDQTTFDYVKARTNEAFEPVYTDAGASVCDDYRCARGAGLSYAAAALGEAASAAFVFGRADAAV